MGFDLAREVARAWLNRWLDDELPAAEQRYREASRRFVALSNEFLERLIESDGAGGRGARQLDPESGFRVRSKLHYTDMMTLEGGPATFVWDVFRTREGTQHAVLREASVYIERLLETNSSRIVGDLNERVLASRLRLEEDIRAALGAVMQSAERALQQARSAQA